MIMLGWSEEGSRTAPPALGAARALALAEVILQLVGQKGCGRLTCILLTDEYASVVSYRVLVIEYEGILR